MNILIFDNVWNVDVFIFFLLWNLRSIFI